MRSPSTIVVCPTRRPSTSVIALRGPGAYTPGAMPRSRARGLVCALATTINAETEQIAEIGERYFHNDLCLGRACETSSCGNVAPSADRSVFIDVCMGDCTRIFWLPQGRLKSRKNKCADRCGQRCSF